MTHITMLSQREATDGLHGSTRTGANHTVALTNGRTDISSEAVRAMGDLIRGLGQGLPQTCIQLARGLEEFRVARGADDLRGGAADPILDAVLLLNQAARKAMQLEELLAAAQFAIAGQGRSVPA